MRYNFNLYLTSAISMKANLYNEVEEKMEAIDEQQLAIGEQKPESIDAPKPTYYIVNYKTLAIPTIIALIIFIVWAIATWLI